MYAEGCEGKYIIDPSEQKAIYIDFSSSNKVID